jgi:hypothetical protein
MWVTLVFQIDYSRNMGDGKLIKPKMDNDFFFMKTYTSTINII